MADMTLRTMLDDVNLSILEPRAASAFAIAGYVNGRYQNWPSIVAKYQHSGKFLLSIDVQGVPSAGAQCLDVEPGDATNATAVGWVKATRAAGVAARDLRYFPKVYTSRANVGALVAALSAAGIPRNTYMVWSAHWGAGQHICGPKTCGLAEQCDATQYTDRADGVSLDESVCYGYFFEGPPSVVAPTPLPPPKPVTPPAPVSPPTPVAPPAPPPAPKPATYEMRTLDAADAAKLGVAAGSVLFAKVS